MSNELTSRSSWGAKNPEEWARILEYIEGGKTYGQITAAINEEFQSNRTRSGIIGACHRAGIIRDTKVFSPSRTTPPKRERNLVLRRVKPPPLPVVRRPATVAVYYGDAFKCSLTELNGDNCRWPLGGFEDEVTAFCGAPLGRGSYCLHHHKISIQPRGERPTGPQNETVKKGILTGAWK